VEWLQHQVLQREVSRATALGENHRAAGVGKVVLCGHSMGGLVVADALLAIEKTCTDGGPLWPRIIAVLAYDTPVSGMFSGQ
jgi:pimeloyl-ACP methyl ester carboxylesterase